VRCTDAQFGDTAGPIRLIGNLRHQHLRRASAGGRRGRSGAAMVNDGDDPWEESLLVDLTDSKAIIPIVD
jgi:hypothetical protein